VADDLAAFVRDLGGDAGALRFRTLAITAEQARIHGLPENPEKPGQYQAEALPPDVLARVMREAASAEVDEATLQAARAGQDAERAAILAALDGLADEGA
jgi:hypothetical protein